MCEFCDAYVKGEDFEWIYKKTFGIIGDVQLDIDAYIPSKKPAIEFVSSIFVSNIGPYEENIESVPITFCPFCGVDLEFEKEKYERQQREKFEKSQKEFDELFEKTVYVTVTDISNESGFNRQTIQQAIKNGKLKAKKEPDGNPFGFKYLIALRDAEEWLKKEATHKKGRPRRTR